jgi:CRISPR/Cas system-associated exonuclease Cas4 (RecB family)
VLLICNSAATDRNTGERSRFISQLIYEPAFHVQQRNVTFRVNIDRDVPIVKERTEEVKRILNRYLADSGEIKRLSPSALNSYLDCRLKFYFRYIDGLKEMDGVTDEIDQSVFGKLLHKTMELIYRPFLGKEITGNDISQLKGNQGKIQQALLQAFAEDYFHTDMVTDSDITGRNIIIREVLMKYIIRILEVDRLATPFTIVSLEKQIAVRIAIHSDRRLAHLNMYGFIDRLDNIGDTLRIVDYKTGNAQRTFPGIAALFDRNKGNHAVLQTLVYACMTNIDRGRKYPRISPSLYIMKELFGEKHEARIHVVNQPPMENYFDIAQEFEAELNQLLVEIFLSDTPFTQTDDHRKCLHCPFADICHRQKNEN